MIKKINVMIRVNEDEPTPSSIKDTVSILSKHDVFSIPVTAKILSTDDFAEENKNQMQQTGKPIQNSRVRERLNRAMTESRQSDRSSAMDPERLTKKPKDNHMSRDSSIGEGVSVTTPKMTP